MPIPPDCESVPNSGVTTGTINAGWGMISIPPDRARIPGAGVAAGPLTLSLCGFTVANACTAPGLSPVALVLVGRRCRSRQIANVCQAPALLPVPPMLVGRRYRSRQIAHAYQAPALAPVLLAHSSYGFAVANACTAPGLSRVALMLVGRRTVPIPPDYERVPGSGVTAGVIASGWEMTSIPPDRVHIPGVCAAAGAPGPNRETMTILSDCELVPGTGGGAGDSFFARFYVDDGIWSTYVSFKTGSGCDVPSSPSRRISFDCLAPLVHGTPLCWKRRMEHRLVGTRLGS